MIIGRLVERLKAARQETIATQDMSRQSLAEAAVHINEQALAHKVHARMLATEMGALQESAAHNENTANILLNQQRVAHKLHQKSRKQHLHEATQRSSSMLTLTLSGRSTVSSR